VHERGLQGVTQARVAEVAGVRQSHVTYYFPTRKDLLKAIAHEHVTLLNEMLGGESKLPMTLPEFRKSVAERVRSKGMPRMMLTLVAGADEDPSLKEWLRKLEADVRRHLMQAFERCGLVALTAYAWAVMRARHHALPHVRGGRARRLHLTSALPVPVQLDGEPAGFTPVEVEVLPAALVVVVV